MKIVSRDELMKMPVGVFYAEYEPCVFGEICIKDETTYASIEDSDYIYGRGIDKPRVDKKRPIDWYQTPVISLGCSDEWDSKTRDGEAGKSFNIDLYNIGRDGCFDDNQLYAVFEKEDLTQLMEKISFALEIR